MKKDIVININKLQEIRQRKRQTKKHLKGELQMNSVLEKQTATRVYGTIPEPKVEDYSTPEEYSKAYLEYFHDLPDEKPLVKKNRGYKLNMADLPKVRKMAFENKSGITLDEILE